MTYLSIESYGKQHRRFVRKSQLTGYLLGKWDILVHSHEDTVDNNDEHYEQTKSRMGEGVDSCSSYGVEGGEEKHGFARAESEEILVLAHNHKCLQRQKINFEI
jgi:hypothetical protein